MTKAELVAKIAAEAGVKKSEAERCVNAFVKALSEALEKGRREREETQELVNLW